VSIERRRKVRHSVYLPAELLVEGTTPRTVITKNISEIGLQLLTRADLSHGESVVLKIYLPGDEMRSVDVRGKAVRLEELSDEERGIWRNKVAFTFDEPQPEVAQRFKEFAAEQGQVHAAILKQK
jgi:hypothetical protein